MYEIGRHRTERRKLIGAHTHTGERKKEKKIWKNVMITCTLKLLLSLMMLIIRVRYIYNNSGIRGNMKNKRNSYKWRRLRLMNNINCISHEYNNDFRPEKKTVWLI